MFSHRHTLLSFSTLAALAAGCSSGHSSTSVTEGPSAKAEARRTSAAPTDLDGDGVADPERVAEDDGEDPVSQDRVLHRIAPEYAVGGGSLRRAVEGPDTSVEMAPDRTRRTRG